MEKRQFQLSSLNPPMKNTVHGASDTAKARTSMNIIQTEVKIGSKLYRAADKMIEATDEVTTELTGKERLLWNLHD